MSIEKPIAPPARFGVSGALTDAPAIPQEPAVRSGPRPWSPARAALTAVATAAVLITGLGAGTASAASVPVRLTHANAPYMVQSTGNLYWTDTTGDDVVPSYTGHVYRMSKDIVPGTPHSLYSETANRLWFGDVTWAKVGGSYYGYFVVNYSTGSKIKRIPLEGSAQATTLANLTTQIGGNDLVADGTSLFWADGAGVRRMPIAGGAISSLATGSGLRHIGLDANRVYYAAGSSIRSVLKTGAADSPVVGTSSPVLSIFVRPDSPTTIYWGESNGTVRSVTPGGPAVTYQAATGRSNSSVSFDGTRVLWTGQSPDLTYHVRIWRSGVTSTVARLSYPAQSVQGNLAALFWTGVYGTYRYTY